MTRRNDKRNNRRNSRQRNNTPELPPFAQMLFGAIVGKGVDMIAKKMAENAEQETPDIHAEGISNQDVTNITKYNQMVNDGSVYFKNEALTNEAIEIMGEESLNDLFSNDW